MYLTCNICGSKQFLVNISCNNDVTRYDYVCAGCGDCIELEDTFTGHETYFEAEICRETIGDEYICLEKWVDEGGIVYYVSLYRKDELLYQSEFSSLDLSEECYKKCTDIFTSIGSINPVIKLLDEC